jgi:hypothetical protein
MKSVGDRQEKISAFIRQHAPQPRPPESGLEQRIMDQVLKESSQNRMTEIVWKRSAVGPRRWALAGSVALVVMTVAASIGYFYQAKPAWTAEEDQQLAQFMQASLDESDLDETSYDPQLEEILWGE